MSLKQANKKISSEISQIRTTLSNYRKVKYKCSALCQDLHQELPRKIHFDSVERETILKMDLLDLSGLVELKNNLAKTLAELVALESELLKKKGTNVEKKELKNTIEQNIVIKPNKLTKRNISLQEIDPQMTVIKEDIEKQDSIMLEKTEKKKQKYRSDLCESPGNQSTFQSSNESFDNRIDKISKQVLSIKKNMNEQANSLTKFPNSQIKQILLDMPIYEKMKEELQNYKMREEEMENLIEHQVSQALTHFLSNLEVIKETKDYKVVKIYKETSESFEPFSSKTYDTVNSRIRERKIDESRLFVSESSFVSEDINNEMKRIDFEKEENVEEVMSKMSEELENSQTRLQELRNQRKKMFENEDIWAEFQKI